MNFGIAFPLAAAMTADLYQALAMCFPKCYSSWLAGTGVDLPVRVRRRRRGLGDAMNAWRRQPGGADACRALYGDRVVRYVVERPLDLLAMFERSRAARTTRRSSGTRASEARRPTS